MCFVDLDGFSVQSLMLKDIPLNNSPDAVTIQSVHCLNYKGFKVVLLGGVLLNSRLHQFQIFAGIYFIELETKCKVNHRRICTMNIKAEENP